MGKGSRFLTGFITARIAFPIMDTYYVSAVGTLVFFLLTCQKSFHAIGFQLLEVFNHTHAVTFPIPPVQAVKVFAGHSVAFAAGLDLVFGEFFASSFDVAVFASRKASCAVGYFAFFPRYAMYVSVVGFAYTAVHSAWRDECRDKFILGHQFQLVEWV